MGKPDSWHAIAQSKQLKQLDRLRKASNLAA